MLRIGRSILVRSKDLHQLMASKMPLYVLSPCCMLPRRMLSFPADDRFNSFNNDYYYDQMLSESLPLDDRVSNLKHLLSGMHIHENIQHHTDSILRNLIDGNNSVPLLSVIKMMFERNLPMSPAIVSQSISIANFHRNYQVSSALVDYAFNTFLVPDSLVWNIKINDMMHAQVVKDKRKLHVSNIYQYVNQLHAHKMHMPTKSYSHLLRLLCECEMPLEAFTLWLSINEQGIPFNQHMFGAIIRLICSVGSLSNAFTCLDACLQRGFVPDRGALVALLRGLAAEEPLPVEDGQTTTSEGGSSEGISSINSVQRKLSQVMQSIQSTDVRLSSQTALKKEERGSDCGVSEKLELARNTAGRRVYQIIDLMHRNNMSVSSDPQVYRSIFSIYLRHGDVINAEFLFWEIIHRQIKIPPVPLFEGLLAAYNNHIVMLNLRNCQPSDGKVKTTAGLTHAEINAWRSTIRNNKQLFCPNINVDELRFLRDKTPVGKHSFVTRQGWEERFPQCEEPVDGKGIPIIPEYSAYDPQLSAEQCCNRMILIYNELVYERRKRPTPEVVRLLLQGAALSQKQSKATLVVEKDFPRTGVQPCERDYGLLIGMFLRQGQRDRAQGLYEEVTRKGVHMRGSSCEDYHIADRDYWTLPTTAGPTASVGTGDNAAVVSRSNAVLMRNRMNRGSVDYAVGAEIAVL